MLFRNHHTKDTKEPRWSARVVLRYTLLQLPAIALLVFVLLFIQRWVNIPPWVFWGSLTFWVAKDVILFPFVWRAYDWDRSGKQNAMVGAWGTTRERLAPSGYILVRGELWQAEVEGGGPPIERGERIKVQGMRGLTLLVTPADKEES